jgi:phage tail tape-measure protein
MAERHKDEKDHRVAEGVGAVGGAVAGIAPGAAIGGPVGAVVGAAVGAVAGGLAGHGVAVLFDPEAEDAYWRENYSSRPYVKPNTSYEDYRDAYMYGGSSRAIAKRAWDDSEDELERGWDTARLKSPLDWSDARDAVHDGWHRVDTADERERR